MDDIVTAVASSSEALGESTECHLPGDPIGMSEESAFESGLAEVYGPPPKRPRFKDMFPSATVPSATAIDTPPRQHDGSQRSAVLTNH